MAVFLLCDFVHITSQPLAATFLKLHSPNLAKIKIIMQGSNFVFTIFGFDHSNTLKMGQNRQNR